MKNLESQENLTICRAVGIRTLKRGFGDPYDTISSQP